jgi:hypothetical protein
MMIFVWLMSGIGILVVGCLALVILDEVIRAARQGHRIATARARCKTYGSTRKPTWRLWWVCAKYDFFNTYSEMIIGPYVLPYDPKKPARPYY